MVILLEKTYQIFYQTFKFSNYWT